MKGYFPSKSNRREIDNMKYAVLVNEEYYLLTKDGANYATFNTIEEAEELALDYNDLNAEVITF
jgi:hypothetical protein